MLKTFFDRAKIHGMFDDLVVVGYVKRLRVHGGMKWPTKLMLPNSLKKLEKDTLVKKLVKVKWTKVNKNLNRCNFTSFSRIEIRVIFKSKKMTGKSQILANLL